MIVQLTCARHEDSHALFSIMILGVAFCALPGEREVNKIINWKTFPGVQWLRLHLPVWTLDRELRSNRPHGQKTKTENRNRVATNSIET